MVYSPFWGSNIFTVPFKYLTQTIQTLWLLLRKRPHAVFVMAPPVFACLPVWIYCRLFRRRFVIDAHTGAFLNPLFKRVQWLQGFFCRRAVTTIVTNDYLYEVVTQWNAPAMIVTDVPVVFADPAPVDLPPTFNITVISSFCADEPTAVLLDAASRLPDVQFHVTGDYRLLDEATRAACPANVRFTGFLSDEEYVGQLQSSDAVMALTTRDHTMQRGAYEAIYLSRPVITSNFDVLRKSFHLGTVHVDASDATSIANGVQDLQANVEHYRVEAEQLRQEKLNRWEEVVIELHNKANGLPSQLEPSAAVQADPVQRPHTDVAHSISNSRD